MVSLGSVDEDVILPLACHSISRPAECVAKVCLTFSQ